MSKIVIHSTAHGKFDVYDRSTRGKDISLYVCGVTPYDDAHIGHGRCYVTFDIIYRLLRAVGFSVSYCRNITDIDDKLLRRAEQELGNAGSYREIAQKYAARFQEDVALLGCLTPTYEPRVTDHIEDIVTCISGLVDRDSAYVRDGSVYFRVRSYSGYGTLSGQAIDELRSGARVAIDDEKEDPLDFALWKSEPEGSFWLSPWGWGRPGWHIECSALAHRFLGNPIDIHGGGMDLLFPHHENERAQSESLHGAPFVGTWVHNAFVRVKSEKMSKSLGNFVTLRHAYDRVDPMLLRYYYATNHYRNPLDFSWDEIAVVEKSYRKLRAWYGDEEIMSDEEYRDTLTAAFEGAYGRDVLRAIEMLAYDVNVQGMIGMIFEHHAEWTGHTKRFVAATLRSVCGFSLQESTIAAAPVMTPEVEALLREREGARLARDWARADILRDRLRSLGHDIQDKKV